MEVTTSATASAAPSNASASPSETSPAKPKSLSAQPQDTKPAQATQKNEPSKKETPKTGAEGKETSETKETEANPHADSKDPAQQPGETKEQHAKRMYKLKVDEQEIEVDEDELKRGYTHARAANERMRQAAEQGKQVRDFMQAFVEDPVAVIDSLIENGMLDEARAIQAMEQRLVAKYKREMMTPEEIEQEKRDRDAQAWRDEQARKQKEKDDAAIGEKAKAIQKDYDTKLTAALNDIDLIKDPDIVKDAASYMKIALEKGYELDVPHIAAMVKEKHQNIARKLVGAMTGEQAIKFLGEEVANKIRKADLARLRTVVPKEEPKAEHKPRERNRAPERLRPAEFLAAARKRAGL